MTLRDIVLAPVIVLQAFWVAARAARLPEASGARSGKLGQGPPLRILVLGDSSAAGVGVQTQSEALGKRLASRMAVHYSVHWKVIAKSGGTVRSTLRMIDALDAERFDIALVALGVNDAKNGVTLRNWVEGYQKLLTLIADKFDVRHICVSGLPPVRHFPILPNPLCRVLGDRVDVFNDRLRDIANKRQDTVFLPLDFTLDTSKMASDGFHPGPDIYDEWAKRAARLIDGAMKRTHSDSP